MNDIETRSPPVASTASGSCLTRSTTTKTITRYIHLKLTFRRCHKSRSQLLKAFPHTQNFDCSKSVPTHPQLYSVSKHFHTPEACKLSKGSYTPKTLTALKAFPHTHNYTEFQSIFTHLKTCKLSKRSYTPKTLTTSKYGTSPKL